MLIWKGIELEGPSNLLTQMIKCVREFVCFLKNLSYRKIQLSKNDWLHITSIELIL